MGYRPGLRSLYWSWKTACGLGLFGLVVGAIIGFPSPSSGAIIGGVLAFGAAITYEVQRYKSIKERVDARDETYELLRAHLINAGPTYLQVPFAEKDQAKSLGACWDPRLRRWYVPPGLSLESFRRWLPQEGSR